MKHGAKAQTLIEYATIAMVVTLALIFGGPFLLNSINGRFRLMNNNVHDSFSENFKQSGGVPSPACSCTSFVQNGCGNPPCAASQMNYSRVCSPMTCQSEFKCVADASCNVTPVDPCAGGGCTAYCDTANGWNKVCP